MEVSAPFEIRRVRRGDLDRIVELERASFGGEAYDRNLFADFYERGALFLAAVRRGRVEGYLVAGFRGERGELISVAVDPAARGKGAASLLMVSLLRRLRRRNVSRLVLMVKERNATARAFYAKYAFRKIRRVRAYYEDGSDGLLMERAV
jgi:ribosomal-protein-alanine acetyltransferase